MSDLWFDRDFGDLSRRGDTIYVSHLEGVWAVRAYPPVYPQSLAQESNEALGLYGASAAGLGHQLLGDGMSLSPSLEEWANGQNIPAAQLGSWEPCLISIDGAFQLALSRDFDGERVFATTWASQHLAVLTPSIETTVALAHQDGLTVPPLGWDSHGGRPESEISDRPPDPPGTTYVGATSTTPLPATATASEIADLSLD